MCSWAERRRTAIMAAMRSFIITLMIVALGAATGCDCEKCDAAIDHMEAKLAQFGCDPSFMEEAQAKIREECGRSDAGPDAIIGVLVETCVASNFPRSSCDGTLAGVDIAVNLQNQLGIDDGVEEVTFAVSVRGSAYTSEILTRGETKMVVLNVNAGDKVDVLASDLQTDTALALSEELIANIKTSPSDWVPYQMRAVRLTGGGTFDLHADNW